MPETPSPAQLEAQMHHLHKRDSQHEIPVTAVADYELASAAPHAFYDPENWPLMKLRRAYREYLAEFFGTFILIMFGDGVVATVTFNTGNAQSSYINVTFGWGIGLAMALYCCMGISGGHLNPAVSFANA
ncbi:aquaporin-like protein, partial [Linderina pennispora]